MKNAIDLNLQTLKIQKDIMKRVVRLGVPAGMTQMIFSLSNIVVQSLTNSLGANVVTACTAIMRVDGFAMLPNFTFGIAATTFTGQNVGARKMDRIHKGTRELLILGLGTSAFMVACMVLFSKNLMQVFTSTDEIIMLGTSMMRLLAIGYIAFSVTQVLQGVMRGAGETIIPMWISVIVTVVIRMPLAYLIAFLTRSAEYPAGNPVCLYSSLLIAWVSGCLISIFVYLRGKWRKRLADELKSTPQEGSL